MLDSSGNSSHLTNYGTTFINENLTTSYVNFANGSYLQIPELFNPFDTWNSGFGITISLKIRTTACGSNSRILDLQPSVSDATGLLIVRPGATNILRIQNNSNVADVPYIWDTNEWRHIIFLISSTGVWRLHINNVNQNTSRTLNMANVGCNLMYIGRSVFPNDGFLTGEMGHLKIY